MDSLSHYPLLPQHKQVFLFGLDDVIYPRKDYDLQVYYLFAQLLEYTEGRPIADPLLEFCKEQYQSQRKFDIFDQIKTQFDLPEKYRNAFHHTYLQGRLPLKLLLFKDVLELLQAMTRAEKKIGLLVRGKVALQWNKIKQTEWNGLDQCIKIYFYDELMEKFPGNALSFVEEALNAPRNAMMYLGHQEEAWATSAGLDYQDIQLYINPK